MIRAATYLLALGAIAAAGCLAGCRPAPKPTPLDQLTPQQASGHSVFVTRCSVCHYDRQYGELHGPSLAGIFKKPALPSGAAATDERVTATVLHGRNLMPAQQNRGRDELNDLLAYLHTL